MYLDLTAIMVVICACVFIVIPAIGWICGERTYYGCLGAGTVTTLALLVLWGIGWAVYRVWGMI